MELRKRIKFRAKGVNFCHDWVQGGLYYTDNNRNDPFGNTPIVTKYFIVSYFNGDWNMGGWEHVEVHPNTIQQFTGEFDSYTNEIYEGDVLRIYNVSYDEDGTRSVANVFTEGVVIFKNGTFFLDADDRQINFPMKSIGTEIEVIGNALTLKKNQTAIDYRAKLLCDNFEINRLDIYPELIDVAFITFSKEVAQIPMDDFVCYYSNEDETLVIKFTMNTDKFVIWRNMDDEPRYEMGVFKADKLTHMMSSENFQTIKDKILNNTWKS
jgi:hypothetical protein